jgi:hypothetical protein
VTIISIAARNAKATGEPRFADTKRGSDVYSQIVGIIRRAWPRKTSAHVAYVTGASERSVQFWLAGETKMSLQQVIALLKTDVGFDILEAIMEDGCKAEWWVVAQVAQNVRRSRKAIEKEEIRIAASRAQLDMIDQIKK